MDDLKSRIEFVKDMLATIKSGPAYPTAYAESCYLQIRKICELMALALAIAHHEMPDFRSQKILSDWNAEKLIKNMLKLNADAFPTAVRIEENKNGPGFHHVQPLETSLDAKFFSKIYNSCGEKLHLGSVKKIVSRTPIKLNLQEVSDWTSAFVKLLGSHVVFLPAINVVIIVVMKSVGHSGAAYCVFAEANDWIIVDGKTQKTNFEIKT